MDERILVSVVIPAYNEEAFIGKLLSKLMTVEIDRSRYELEFIVVNDGSTDKTEEIVLRYPEVRYYSQLNSGKGSAVQNGISKSFGQFILIQDADLEYDVSDYKPILDKLTLSENSTRTSVYGSRTTRPSVNGSNKSKYSLRKQSGQSIGPWIANIALSIFVLILYRKWISDTLTGYKLYPKDFFNDNEIFSSGFEADHEITAKLLRQGYAIKEVPISYNPRTKQDGKKIRAVDGLIALKVYILERIRS